MIIKYLNSLTKNKITISILFFQFVFVSTNALAQNPYSSTPERGLSNGKAYDVSNIERVGFEDGSVSLTIPLASLPPVAGGKLGFTVNAYYNSKPWKIYSQQDYLSSPQLLRLRNDQVTPWRIGGGYRVAIERVNEDEFQEPSDACEQFQTRVSENYFTDYARCNAATSYNYRFYVYTPDGGKHELRTFDYPTYPNDKNLMLYRNAAYKDSPTSVNSPIRFYTFDGSYMWVQINPTANWWNTNNWTILMKDGTKIVNTPDNVQRIVDNNGNSIKIYTDTGNVTHYEDELTGREIKVMPDPLVNNGQQVAYRKVGGDWEYIKIKWEDSTVTGLYIPDNAPCSMATLEEGVFPVIREIQFPSTVSGVTGQKFSFEFNSDTLINTNGGYYVLAFPLNCQTTQIPQNQVSAGWGEVSKVTFPSGATTEYQYSGNTLGSTLASDIRTNRIISKKLVHDGTEDIWTYAGDEFSAQVVNPDNSVDKYYFIGGLGGSTGFSNYRGLTYKEEHSGKVIIEKRWKNLRFDGTISDSLDVTFQKYNSVVEAEYTTLLENGNPVKTSAKTFQYDYNGNVTQTNEFDWFDSSLLNRDAYGPTDIPAGVNPLRVTTSEYYNPAGTSNSTNIYAKQVLHGSSRILNAIKKISTHAAANSYIAQTTQFSYDEQSYGTAPIKGNVTTVSNWLDTTNQWLNTTTSYDIYGNPVTVTAPKGNVAQIFYEDTTHALPTKTIIDPQNGTGQQITLTSYDYYTGLPLTATDLNGNVSSLDYTNHLLGTIDPSGRPGNPHSPYVNVGGVSKRGTTKFYYYDNAKKTITQSDLFDENDGLLKARTSRDEIGRPILTERNENGAAEYTISSQSVYKAAERVVLTSNPKRSAASSTDGWTRATGDNLGRTTEVATFSGTAQPPVTGTNSNWTGSVTTDYTANIVTATDQAGKQRRSITNTLGQLTRVDEPDAAGNLGAVSSPMQATTYTYDTLNNLTTVNQGQQTRTFTYDSLSRLKSVTNPEMGTTSTNGTINYTYDNNGNLTGKTDARGITTNYVYDNLNRVITRSYANEPSGQTPTPNVSYFYDNLPNAKGRLIKVTSSVSETRYTSFDNLGRLLTHEQRTTAGQLAETETPYQTAYSYNLSGGLVEQTYPSGRKVKNVLSNDGQLALVQSKKNANAGYFNYANSLTYNAAGATESMQLGNGKWESTQFNSRLQPTQIALGTVKNGTDKLKLNFDYGGATNNGNILSQTIKVENTATAAGFTAIQTYNYDELNRLKSAEEKIANATSWKQTYTFDRYGNRRFDTNLDVNQNKMTTTLDSNCTTAVCNPTIDPATNKLIGYTFDDAGNTKVDASGRTFTYDAENKQTKVVSGGNIVGEYFYDGDGKRVKKKVNGEETIFVYNASGQLVAEYTNQTPQNAPRVSYLTSDHLGSPRITTDVKGDVYTRRDFMPYGEEIEAKHTSSRTAGLNYAVDEIKQKFTSYERDNETELDFAQARYYNKQHGRFTAVDPLLASGKSSDPQTFNRYDYVLNNPLKLIDPDGRSPSTHIDEKGHVITVINDNDTGVYQHKNNADGKEPTEYMLKKRQKEQGTSAGGTKIGATQYWDEFVSPETGKPYTNYTIQVGKQFNTIVESMHEESKGMDLRQIATASGNDGKFDIKKKYANVGALLNGLYVTSRSAGNYLAGYNARSGTYFGAGISFDTFQKMAGGMQVLKRNLTKTELTRILTTGYQYAPAPTFGELEYQRRMSIEGWIHTP